MTHNIDALIDEFEVGDSDFNDQILTNLCKSSYEKLLPPLVHEHRKKVKTWRESGYQNATETSVTLLNWWFKTEHLLPNYDGSIEKFEYYFAQREAVETIVYLYDVVKAKDKYDLLRFDSSGAVSAGMFDETWLRFVAKMATGAGKTKVMSLVLAWCYFHKLYEADSALARNFLLITPNIIVLDRIRSDFDGLRIFFADPVLPDNGYQGQNWRDDFQLTLHIQDDVNITRKTGNIFLTNIHRVYAGNDVEPSFDDTDMMDYFLGKRPTGATTDSKVNLSDIVRDIDELVVINDEAHHIMTDDTQNCDDVAAYLKASYPELKKAVLVIHTKNNGEISEASTGKNKDDLELLRKQSNQIDSWESPYKAIVSVLMQKEGWDVKNVTTIVGLRAYSAKSNILPEQILGRGLRKMYPGNDVKEYVSVVGSDAFMDFVESIQSEGVELEHAAMGTGTKPKTPIIVEIDNEDTSKNLDRLDIEIPVLTARTYREYKNLEQLDVTGFGHKKVGYRKFTEEEQKEIVFYVYYDQRD